MRLARHYLAIGSLLACLSPPIAPARAAEDRPEQPAGGVLIAPHPGLVVEQKELRIRPDRIQASYVVRYIDEAPRAFQLAVPLPDIEAQSAGQGGDPPRLDPGNFIAASIEVDGIPVVPLIEQRALALGLDVSEVLSKQGLPLFPHAAGLRERLAALPEAVRRDFEERGILHVEEERVEPSWTLKTVQHWRQPFAAARTVRIVLSYTPIAGRVAADAAAVAARERSHCIDRRAAEAILAPVPVPAGRLASDSGAAAPPPLKRQMRLITYHLATGVVLPGPIGRFRLIVEKPDDQTIVALCRDGIVASGPRTLEWSATDFWPDDDLHVLFAR